jgi:hypothetical protein
MEVKLDALGVVCTLSMPATVTRGVARQAKRAHTARGKKKKKVQGYGSERASVWNGLNKWVDG